MTNEDYVTYETAQALKKAGFDWKCTMAYFDRPWNHEHRLVSAINACNQQCAYVGTDVYPAPTLAQAQKWLREAHRLSVEPVCNMVRQWNVNVCEIDNFGEPAWSKIGLDSYESALAAGIEAALNIVCETEKRREPPTISRLRQI